MSFSSYKTFKQTKISFDTVDILRIGSDYQLKLYVIHKYFYNKKNVFNNILVQHLDDLLEYLTR